MGREAHLVIAKIAAPELEDAIRSVMFELVSRASDTHSPLSNPGTVEKQQVSPEGHAYSKR